VTLTVDIVAMVDICAVIRDCETGVGLAGLAGDAEEGGCSWAVRFRLAYVRRACIRFLGSLGMRCAAIARWYSLARVWMMGGDAKPRDRCWTGGLGADAQRTDCC
jgi:hypothetical protein